MTDKYVFKDCSLTLLEKRIGVQEVMNKPVLLDWLSRDAEVSDYDHQKLIQLQQKLRINFRHWNETELAYGFIAPLMDLVDFSGNDINFFAERTLAGQVGPLELSGKPDGLIASGLREPERPYFCLHEYKREEDAEGDPAGQVLAAMLVAQELNKQELPIYGCYVKGNIWYLLVLEGLEYSISDSYSATGNDIFDL
ncbi:MAG: hypothetical protein AAF639_34655, partial [Chloroflexota bacterium]